MSRNLIADIGPLVENPNLGSGDWITLTGNPLSEESLNVHVPALRDRGVQVAVDSVRLLVSPDTRAASFDVSGYFGVAPDLAVGSDAGDHVQAKLEDGTLQVTLGAAAGPATVNVTATDNGTTETLAFEVSVRQVLALFPSAASTAYQGFVRVTSHSPKPGRVVVHATDDEGRRHGPVTLSLAAYATAPFNSQDLEHGNAAKGLSDGIGAGMGDWRLEFGSNLDIEVLGYARTADGFVTTLHELAPRTGDDRVLPFLNPGSNTEQVSRLRLVNTGADDAEVALTGVDDQGGSPGGTVRLSVAPGTARTLTAADLEAGEGATGALGDGTGKWRLVVESPDPVYAMSLLESPTGHLTNLSSGPVRAADGTHTVPLFPAAGDPDGRQGFVRVVNREDRAGTVTIAAIDDAGQHHDSVTLTLSAGATAPFNSNDLEQGNPDKGLTDGVGAGTGDWRLALSADVPIDVYAYIRHTDGFVTSMHDAAPALDTHHRVGFLNPRQQPGAGEFAAAGQSRDGFCGSNHHRPRRPRGVRRRRRPPDRPGRSGPHLHGGATGRGRCGPERRLRLRRRQVAPDRRLERAHPGDEPAREPHRPPHQPLYRPDALKLAPCPAARERPNATSPYSTLATPDRTSPFSTAFWILSAARSHWHFGKGDVPLGGCSTTKPASRDGHATREQSVFHGPSTGAIPSDSLKAGGRAVENASPLVAVAAPAQKSAKSGTHRNCVLRVSGVQTPACRRRLMASRWWRAQVDRSGRPPAATGRVLYSWRREPHMSQPVVDTLQLCDALRKTGMEREQAEGLARALGGELGEHVVAEGDLQTGFLQVRGEIESVDHRVSLAQTELVGQIRVLDGKIDNVRTELGGRIDALDGKIDSVRTELGGRIDALDSKLTFVIAGVGLFVAAVTLVGRLGVF